MLRTTIVAGLIVCGLLARGGSARADGIQSEPQPTLFGIVFEGAEQLGADELKRCTSLAAGMPFDEAKASADCAAIVRYYQERGYPFVTCSPSLGCWGVKVFTPLMGVTYHI